MFLSAVRCRVVACLMTLALLGPGLARRSDARPMKFGSKSVKADPTRGKDPLAFRSAKEMLAVKAAAQRLTADEAEKALKQLEALARRGELPERPRSRALLRRLDGAPDLALVQARLTKLAGRYLRRARRGSKSVSVKVQAKFHDGNRKYKARDLNGAVGHYRKLLGRAPGHIDGRNNLGLARLHQDHRVSALAHFLLLARLAPGYHGARVNLTVALTRLGLERPAFREAQAVAKASADYPMALYNKAWLASLRGEFLAAEVDFEAAIKQHKGRRYYKAIRATLLNALELGKPAPKVAQLPPKPKVTKRRPRPGSWAARYRRRARSKYDPIPKSVRKELDPLVGITPPRIRIKAGRHKLYDQGKVIGEVGPGTFMVSDKRGDWVAIYWHDGKSRRRAWLDARQLQFYQPFEVF